MSSIARHCGAVIDSVEVRVRNLDEIDLVRKHLPPGTTVLFEISPEQADEFLPILRHIGGCAKLRTGGVVEEAFPAVEQIAGFIARCAELGVPFKATAGLHHPLRCIRPLTYEPNSPRGTDARIPEPLYRGCNCVDCACALAVDVPRAMLATCLADRRARKLALWRRRADLERRRGADADRPGGASLDALEICAELRLLLI